MSAIDSDKFEAITAEEQWFCSRCGATDFYADRLQYNKIALVCKNCLKRSEWQRNELIKLEEEDE